VGRLAADPSLPNVMGPALPVHYEARITVTLFSTNNPVLLLGSWNSTLGQAQPSGFVGSTEPNIGDKARRTISHVDTKPEVACVDREVLRTRNQVRCEAIANRPAGGQQAVSMDGHRYLFVGDVGARADGNAERAYSKHVGFVHTGLTRLSVSCWLVRLERAVTNRPPLNFTLGHIGLSGNYD
jgi:hypothetical protein